MQEKSQPQQPGRREDEIGKEGGQPSQDPRRDQPGPRPGEPRPPTERAPGETTERR